MAPLVKYLQQIGYADGETLFGAPYDFRYGLAAEGHPSRVGSQFLQDLKQLIETSSASNGDKPVILLSHSLGGLFALQLLARNSPSWRRRFVKHFVALSAPWGGSVQVMLTFASGNALGVPFVRPLIVRGEQRSSESNLWLLPSPEFFQNPIVITPNRSYTAEDIPEFLRDIGFEKGVGPYESRILPLVKEGAGAGAALPGVAVTCIVGSGVETAERLVYSGGGGRGGFDEGPVAVDYGDGDGTVNMVSLLGLQSVWGEERIRVRKLKGVSHTSILSDEAAIDEIVGVISEINSVGALSSAL